MLEIIKKLFASTDNSSLKDAVKNGAFLVDVRTPAEFLAGSVKSAVNIPLDTLPAHLSKLKNKKNIVVFCRSGNRSGQAENFFKKNGFHNVVNGGTWKNVNQIINETRI
jgi:phage shock protein E